MLKMSSFCLHASHDALAQLHNSIVNNPLTPTAVHIPDFIPPTLWPPNNPDLNPVDYKVWSMVQEQIYHTPILDVNDLKQRLLDVWTAVVVCSFNRKKRLSNRNSFTKRVESEIINVINENKMSKSKCQKLLIKCYW